MAATGRDVGRLVQLGRNHRGATMRVSEDGGPETRLSRQIRMTATLDGTVVGVPQG